MSRKHSPKHRWTRHGAAVFGIGSGALMNQLSRCTQSLSAFIVTIIAVGFIVVGLSWMRSWKNNANP